MNTYALFPLIATLAYIPLLASTIFSRPWNKRKTLFLMFLIPAMIWSLEDIFLRGTWFIEYRYLVAQMISITFTWAIVQFYVFSSSFFSAGYGRWTIFAYTVLVVVSIIVVLGLFPRDVLMNSDKSIRIDYGFGMYVIMIPLLIIAGRSIFIFFRMIRVVENPEIHNQIVSLILGWGVFTVFTLLSVFPWMKEFPLSHFGNLINAIIFSYATIRHKLVPISFVIRKGLVWIALGVLAVICYWGLVVIVQELLGYRIDIVSALAASALAIVVAGGVYTLRNIFSEGVGKVIQGESFAHRQNLSAFVANIHKTFSFKERGTEFLNLVNNAIGCNNSSLLLLEPNSEDFHTSFIQPESSANTLVDFNLPGDSPIADYLKHNTKPLARSSLEILPELRGLWKDEQARIKKHGIELFIPMVSREKLIGILLTDKKKSGRYSLADYNLLEESAAKVALSLEKEYIQEQLKERERELSIINRSSSIITSSLNIQQIYDNFTEQLRQIVDVNWTAIMVIEETEARVLTISAETGNVWQVGERIPIKGTAIEWVSLNKESLVEPDLTVERRFETGKYLLEQGIRTMAHIPLKAGDKVTGVLEVTSRNPNAYSTHQVKLLEELAAQIAISVENSRLFAKTEQMVRIDSLTSLLNRRSLDELITNEINRHTRYGGVFSLIILDLDGLKKINDTLGHLAGDEILKKVSHITRDAIRSADQAFRYGGDEFAILLPQTSPDAAQAIAERIRNRIGSENMIDNTPVSVSLGVASWPMDALEMTSLITAADTALYDAKHAGGNTSRCFNISMQPMGKAKVGTIGDDSSHLSTIYALAAAVDARDRYTRSHSKKVNDYASALAEALNMTQLEKSRLSMCALLHDLGKIGVSSEILNKSGKLTDEEWIVLKKHPKIGASIIAQIPHLVPCVPGILYHHERYDGKGYPEGKKGEDIPLEARILCVADSFAAMTSERHYLTAMTFEKGIEELKRNAGTQFDPALIELFVTTIKEPIRTL